MKAVTYAFPSYDRLSQNGANHIYSIAKQEIEIRKHDGDSFKAYFAGRALTVSEVVEPTKPTLYDTEIQKKIDAIDLAEKLGNVAEAARRSGCSRETIYKNRRLLQKHGPLALKRTFQPGKHHKNRTSADIEHLVVTFSLENPHLGQAQVAAQLRVQYQLDISPSGVRHIWLREKMNTCALRLALSRSSAVV